MKAIFTWITLSIIIIATPSAQSAGLINGGFESPGLGSVDVFYPYYSQPAGFGWVIPAPSGIDLIRHLWQPSSGQQSIDLSGYGPSAIYQDFTFPSSGSWSVKFDMSVNPAAGGSRSVGVSFGLASGSLSSIGVFSLSPTGRTLINMAWEEKTTVTFNVNASSTYRLQFVALDGDASGVALDNVTIAQVPEPTSLALVGLGAFLMVDHFRRR